MRIRNNNNTGTCNSTGVFNINNVTGNVSSVTLLPGEAYKIQTTTSSITLNHDATLVPEGKYGLESHLEIFVANTGYVVTGTNVVLAEAFNEREATRIVVGIRSQHLEGLRSILVGDDRLLEADGLSDARKFG